MADSLSVTSASDDDRDTQPHKRVKRILKRNEMRVYLRFRPLGPEQFRGPIGFNEEEKRLEGISSDEYLNSRVDDFRGLQFNRIFSETCPQDEFYTEVIAPILPDIFKERKSSVIFAYGVTNSGKTHSILGSSQSLQSGHQGDGILPRVLRFLVQSKKAIVSRLSEKIDFFHEENISTIERPSELACFSIDGIELNLNTFSSHPSNSTLHLRDVKVMFENFEIYNEDIYDLQGDGVVNLDTSNFIEKKSASKKASASKTKLKLKEDLNKRVFIKDLVTNEVTDLDEASRLIKVAVENRRVRNNNLNAASSRSQCCFKIRIKFLYSHPFQALEEEASLLILDLAGAERAKKTLNTGAKMAESCHINKTLLSLGNCIRALRNGDESIPYRDSKLTRVLREYFVDRNHVIMIVHLHPGLSYFDENINVLKYAAIGLEAKLKAAISLTDSKNQQNQYSFLLDSGSKKQDKSLLSQMNLFTSLADQEHFLDDNNHGEDHMQHDGAKGQRNQYQKELEHKTKEVDEKMRELEEKQHDLELKEIIMKQKLALEKFDLNFESMMQQEEAKLKMEREILMRFRMPDFQCDFEQNYHGNVEKYDNNQDIKEQKNVNQQQSENQNRLNQQLSQKEQHIQNNQSNQLVQNSQDELIRRQESSQLSEGQVKLEQNRIIQDFNSNGKNKQQEYITPTLNTYQESTPPRLSRRFDDENEFEDQNNNNNINIQENVSQAKQINSEKHLSQYLHKPTSIAAENNVKNNNYHDGLKNQEERLIKRLLEVQLQEITNENRNSTNGRFSVETFIENTSHNQAQSQEQRLGEIHQDERDINISYSQSEGEDEGDNIKDNEKEDDRIISRRSSLMDQNDKVVIEDQGNEINRNDRNQDIENGQDNQIKSEMEKQTKQKDVSNIMNNNNEVDQNSQSSNKIIKQNNDEDACRTPGDNEKTFIQQSTDKRQAFNNILRVSSEISQNHNSNQKGSSSSRMEEEIIQQRKNSNDNNSQVEVKCSQELLTNEGTIGSLIQSQTDQQEDKLQGKMAKLEKQVQELQIELEMQQDQLLAREKQVAKQEEELSTLRTALAEKYTVQQEQIEKSMLNSEQLRNQLVDQELKFTDETHKIMELQKNIADEIRLLKEERIALQNKSEKLKSLQPTPVKLQEHSKHVAGIVHGSGFHNVHQNVHVNFDLGQNSEEKQRTPGRKNSDTIYPGHPIKTFSEKQIQTSAVRSVNSNKTISSQSSQPSQVDVGVYTYYTYSESDQGQQHVGQNNGINGSQIGNSVNLTNSGQLGNKSKNNRGIIMQQSSSGNSNNNKQSKNHVNKIQQVQQSPVSQSNVKKDLFLEQNKAGLGDIVERIEDENERINEERNDNTKEKSDMKNEDKVDVEKQVIPNEHGTMEIEKNETQKIKNIQEDNGVQVKENTGDEDNLKYNVEKQNDEGKDVENEIHEKVIDEVELDVNQESNQDQENKRQRGKKKGTKKQYQATSVRRSSRNSTGSVSKNNTDDENNQTEEDDNETEEEKEGGGEEEDKIVQKGKINKRNKKTTRSTSRDSSKSNKNKKNNNTKQLKGSSIHSSETEDDSKDLEQDIKPKPTKVTNKKKNHRK